MNAEEWQRSKDLFSAAVALAESDREPFLQLQTESTEVQEEVRSLLMTYQQSSDFLDDSVSELSEGDTSRTGLEAGKRELLRRLEAILEGKSKAHADWFGSEREISGGEEDGSALAELETSARHIGAYKILRRLGEGGMGVAYLAERDDGAYRHEVAIKVLKDGLRDPGLKKRFQNERQVLAGLEHPFIARLIDGGTTASGQPYYPRE